MWQIKFLFVNIFYLSYIWVFINSVILFCSVVWHSFKSYSLTICAHRLQQWGYPEGMWKSFSRATLQSILAQATYCSKHWDSPAIFSQRFSSVAPSGYAYCVSITLFLLGLLIEWINPNPNLQCFSFKGSGLFMSMHFVKYLFKCFAKPKCLVEHLAMHWNDTLNWADTDTDV